MFPLKDKPPKMVEDKTEKIKEDEEESRRLIIGYDYVDFDRYFYQTLLTVFIIRFGWTMTFGELCHHPDQNWQGLEIAYTLAYGDEVENIHTWEWQDRYTLRSSLYPIYLSIPLHILRFFKIDYNVLVVNSMFLMNTFIIVIGDYYLYLISKTYMGKRGAAIALLWTLFNYRINQIFLKTLTNGVESVFCTVAFYYFSLLKPKFDKNMALMTFSITMAFIARSSSLVGFLPIAIY